MAVRPAVPWYWRSLGIVAAGAVLLAAAWLVVNAFGGIASVERAALEREVASLRVSADRQERELAELRARAAHSERQHQIESAAAADLAKQIKALTSENAALKEDLAFFQTLVAGAGGREGAISVNRFRLQPEGAAGEYRYQMLLVQSGQRGREFRGRLQFVVDVHHEGRKVVLVLPAEGDQDGRDYQLNFRFFQRIEGTFKLMPGSTLKGMQVRVFENGSRAPKLTQTLTVS